MSDGRHRVTLPHVFTPNGMKPAGNPAPNLPNLMEPLPIQSDHQRLLVAYSDMPPNKRCRLGPPNPHPKIMKLSNQLGDFRNALKQSLFTTKITHKRYLTKPDVQCAANTCTTELNFPTPEKYCSTKGECCTPLRQRPGKAHKRRGRAADPLTRVRGLPASAAGSLPALGRGDRVRRSSFARRSRP
jgi:hypothetical protein